MIAFGKFSFSYKPINQHQKAPFWGVTGLQRSPVSSFFVAFSRRSVPAKEGGLLAPGALMICLWERHLEVVYFEGLNSMFTGVPEGFRGVLTHVCYFLFVFVSVRLRIKSMCQERVHSAEERLSSTQARGWLEGLGWLVIGTHRLMFFDSLWVNKNYLKIPGNPTNLVESPTFPCCSFFTASLKF